MSTQANRVSSSTILDPPSLTSILALPLSAATMSMIVTWSGMALPFRIVMLISAEEATGV